MSKQRICVDMDEVLADSVSRFQEWYGRDFQRELTHEALHGKHLFEAVAPEHQPAIRAYANTPGFFRDLPLMADSQRVMQALSEKYELFIASAAMEFSNSFLDKYEWLQKHFPYISWRNYVFCGDKSILHADYLIDDNAYNFAGFQGQGLLFTAPHNALEPEADFRRVHSWAEVGDLLL